jgi:hypothetical protein
MTPFEYVSVLISIVLGLGITQVVSGTADLIHQWERVKLYWPHMLLVILIFFLHIQEWWVLFELRNNMQWRIPTFFMTILYPICLFILARILFPVAQSDEPIDIKAFYFANYRKFFLMIAVLAFVSFIDNVFIHGYPVSTQAIPLVLMSVMTWGTVRGFEQEWVHKILVTSLLVVMLGGIVVEWDEWTLSN